MRGWPGDGEAEAEPGARRGSGLAALAGVGAGLAVASVMLAGAMRPPGDPLLEASPCWRGVEVSLALGGSATFGAGRSEDGVDGFVASTRYVAWPGGVAAVTTAPTCAFAGLTARRARPSPAPAPESPLARLRRLSEVPAGR